MPERFETLELKHWTITFSPMATLVPSEGDSVYSTIAELSRDEIEDVILEGRLEAL